MRGCYNAPGIRHQGKGKLGNKEDTEDGKVLNSSRQNGPQQPSLSPSLLG